MKIKEEEKGKNQAEIKRVFAGRLEKKLIFEISTHIYGICEYMTATTKLSNIYY